MAAPAQHIERAKRNQRFAEHFDLDKTEFLDWVVVGYFYSALQWIDAYISAMHIIPDQPGHAGRHRVINTLRELTGVSRSYRKLYSYSQNARYDLKNFSPEDIRRDVIPKVQQVRTHVEPLLKQAGVAL